MKQLIIIGAGWAGLSAAVAATQVGWQVRLFEATTHAGGRARSLTKHFAGQPLDNGQHVLIGAYRDTLALMRTVGLNPDTLLRRVPLDLRFADGQGLCLRDWPSPVNLLEGVARAQGWSLKDKASLIQASWRWQRAKFSCDPTWTVAQLCDEAGLSPRVLRQLIEPLCLSALNTPVDEASATVFLRVLRDALMGERGSSDLLIPVVDLGALLPEACVHWLRERGADIRLGERITPNAFEELARTTGATQPLLLACPPWEAARLSVKMAPDWANACAQLPHAAIATVYLRCNDHGFSGLPQPMLALHAGTQAPAQFVFDRGTLNAQTGLLAAVVSACTGENDEITEQVRKQVAAQLNLTNLETVQTVIEKRATLSCWPMLERPDTFVASGVWACGDYIHGPYPSTLEGAVRSGQQAITQLSPHRVAEASGYRLNF